MNAASIPLPEPYGSARVSPVSYVPEIAIYADASCLRNGSPDSAAGSGAVLIDLNKGDIKLQSIYLGRLTNQKAEITACANALKALRRPCRVEIFSDSRYVIETMVGKSRMKTNHSFWNDLIRSCFRHHTTWSWIRGHSGNVFQEIADRLARAAAMAERDLREHDLEQLSSMLSIEPDQAAIRDIEARIASILALYLGSERDIRNASRDFLPSAAPFTLPSAF